MKPPAPSGSETPSGSKPRLRSDASTPVQSAVARGTTVQAQGYLCVRGGREQAKGRETRAEGRAESGHALPGEGAVEVGERLVRRAHAPEVQVLAVGLRRRKTRRPAAQQGDSTLSTDSRTAKQLTPRRPLPPPTLWIIPGPPAQPGSPERQLTALPGLTLRRLSMQILL